MGGDRSLGRRMVAGIVKRLLVLVVLFAATTADAPPGRATVVFVHGVPRDVRVLTSATWERFVRTFPARQGCLRPVMVAAAWDLDDRAEYDPGHRTLTVRIPGTAPNLAASLVHEFAHHLEFTCSAHIDLRPVFLAAQGFPPGTPWFDGPTWEETPSEQYAEAAVEIVLGSPHAHATIAISDPALGAVRAWARGEVTDPSMVSLPARGPLAPGSPQLP